MKRLELYVSNGNRLVLGVFDPADSEYEKYTLKGEEAYKYLRKLEREKILDIIKEPKYNEMSLVYKNYIVNLNEYETLLNRRGLKIIIDDIKEYVQKENLEKIKGKKVKRKNKHAGKRIAATGLALFVLGTCALGLARRKNSNDNVSSTIVEEQITNEDEISKLNLKVVFEENLDVESDETLDYELEDDYDEPIISEKENLVTVSVDYADRSDTVKATTTQNNYGSLINKYAEMYGVDPALALAVATQERGVHSSITDAGGATGLMQIQNAVWLGQKVSAYNFQTGQTESFIVTIDQLQNLESNIKIGCMILQNSFQYMKYNTLAAVQCYNMGYGNMMKILKQYASDNNMTVDQVLSDIEDDGWLRYRYLVTQGDQEYIEHVLSWMGEEVTVKNVRVDGTLTTMNINNNFNSKKVY